ncbi:MAG: OmpH family outer membrane protein [Paludibacteraceae bacterium]|jgi:Outer membrane protein|nr:OmpH family outer membrane protein [Paludibacteraceae bacterium]MBO7456154.1 OmpH family outer membrane protein [Paludibacteraceae bacterium]
MDNNKLQFSINILLGLAVAALFILVFKFHNSAAPEAPAAPVSQDGPLPVAYVNLDSILQGYTFALEAQDKLMTRQENARMELNQKARTLQNEMVDFQKKLENNAFLSRQRAESEQQRILKKQQDLENREAQLTQEILQENQQLQAQLADTILSYLKELNAEGRYQMIFSNNAKDNILLSVEGYDITAEVVSALNARYTPKKK